MLLQCQSDGFWSLSLTDNECVVLSAPTHEYWTRYRGEWRGRRLKDGSFRFEPARDLKIMATDALDRVAEVGLARYAKALLEDDNMEDFVGWVVPEQLHKLDPHPPKDPLFTSSSTLPN